MGKLENFDLKKYHFEKKVRRIIVIVISLLFLLLFLAYYVIGIIYNSGNFSVTLDKNLYFDDGLIIYDDPTYKVYRSELLAPAPDTFDNISYKWLPKDITEHEGGSHNGDNYWMFCSSISFHIEDILDCDYVGYDDCVFTDKDFLEEYIADQLYDEYCDKSEEEYEAAIKRKMEEFEPYWTKVIAIYATN